MALEEGDSANQWEVEMIDMEKKDHNDNSVIKLPTRAGRPPTPPTMRVDSHVSQWTTELPTKEGWYWNCSGGECRIKEIDRDCRGNLIVGNYHYDDYSFLRKDSSYWMGPLQLPEPPL